MEIKVEFKFKIRERIEALEKILSKVIELEINDSYISEEIKEAVARELLLIDREYRVELDAICDLFQIESLEDYELCEGCNKAKSVEEMKSDVDGVPLCQPCLDELIEHTLSMEPKASDER